MSDQKRSW